jgi:hypothetical protein
VNAFDARGSSSSVAWIRQRLPAFKTRSTVASGALVKPFAFQANRVCHLPPGIRTIVLVPEACKNPREYWHFDRICVVYTRKIVAICFQQ